MKKTLVRLAVLALAAAPVLAGTAAPASAATERYLSRTTGFVGTAEWTQVLDLGAAGNVHVGYLHAYETRVGFADVFSTIEDFRCAPGQLPGGHGDDGGCEYAGSRLLVGEGVPFTVARKAASARLKGTLTAKSAGDPHSGEGGTTLGRVPADFTWTSVGAPARTRSTFSYQEDGRTLSETYRATARRTTLSGQLGPMRFEAAASAEGRLEAFKSSTRFRG